ncbi:trypsin-like serine protease [Kitasatospora sp. NPDC001660]
MASRIPRWMLAGTVVAASVVLAPPGLAAADAAQVVNSTAPFAVEDGAYPGTAQIQQDLGITLTSGDARINLTSCDSSYQIKIWTAVPQANNYGNVVCFTAPYTTGRLTMSIPDVFAVQTYNGVAVAATMTTGTVTTKLDVPANKWVGTGRGKDPNADPTTMLELHVTANASGLSGPPAAAPALPAVADPFEGTARIDIGGKRICSGALVDPSWLLTAASCFIDHPEQGIAVPAGAPADPTTATFVRSTAANPPLPSTFTVTELVPRTDRDLVLAHLAAPVPGIAPVPVTGKAPSAGEMLDAGGFGRTETEWAHDRRNERHSTVGAVSATGLDTTPTNTTPATPAPGVPAGGIGVHDGPVCKGATGGPLLRILGSGRWELAAVTSRSWQNGCLGSDETARTGAYDTRVDDLAPWLQQYGVYAASGYTAVPPTRVLDTRDAGGSRTWTPNQGGGEKVLNLGPSGTGQFKLPQGATAVVLNVTVVAPSHGGFLTVEPNDTAHPTASSVNFAAGQTIANLVTAPVGPDGRVVLWTNVDDFDALVDVAGYYSPASPNKFAPSGPVRLLDTRDSGGALGQGSTVDVQITGRNGVPTDATAVVVNLTTTGSTAGGYFAAYPTGSTRPATSNINFGAGDTLSNQAVVPIGKDGKITVFNFAGSAHAIVDLAGYYGPSGTDLYHPASPSRLLDTRSDSLLGPGQVVSIGGFPYGADAVVLNVTTTQSDQGGYFTLYPHGIDRPPVSDLNFGPGQTLSNHATVPLGQNQLVDLANLGGHSHAVVDLFGYFTKN